MKVLVKDKNQKDDRVFIYLEQSAHGVRICAENADGYSQILAEIDEEGRLCLAKLGLGASENLGLNIDYNGNIKISR